MEMSNGYLRLNRKISSRVVPIENVTTLKRHSTCTYLFVSFFAINTQFLDINCHVSRNSCESVEAYEVCQFTHVFFLEVLRSPVSAFMRHRRMHGTLTRFSEIEIPLCDICIFLQINAIAFSEIGKLKLFSRNLARFRLNERGATITFRNLYFTKLHENKYRDPQIIKLVL